MVLLLQPKVAPADQTGEVVGSKPEVETLCFL